MPRAAWLALGATAAALALPIASPVVVLLVAAAALLLASAARAAGHRELWRRVVPAAIGVAAIGLRAATAGASAPPAAVPAGDGPWAARVQSVGAPRAGARPAVVLLQAAPPAIVAATLPWYPAVVPGDRIELTGRIRAPPEDDYGEYLARIGAVGTLRVESLRLLPAEGSLAGTLEGLRRAAATGLDRAMAEPEAGLAAGVLIGLRDRVDRDLAAAFTTAGASHVVAISGWNIAIVASTLAAVAGGLRRRRRAILTAVAIVVYVAFVGPSASVVRAGVMAGVALLARELGRPGTAAAALGWAVAGLLLVDPAYVDDAGFRLSVLATAGIIAWGTTLVERLAGPSPGRGRRWVAEILGVSFAAQAATTPIVLLEFGRLSLVAPLVNLIVVPLVPPAMAAGAIALGAGVIAGLGLPPVLAVLVGLPAWLLYAAMVWVVRIGAALPLASLELEPPWDLASAVGSAALIVGVARWGGRLRGPPAVAPPAVPPTRSDLPGPSTAGRRAAPGRAGQDGGRRRTLARLAMVALAGAFGGLALAFAYRPGGVAHLVVLDVGQGDAILVDGGHGSRMLVDGGPDPGKLLIALDERLPPWDRRIDIVVLTHPHEDHVAGLALLLERYRVGRVYESGLPGSSPGYAAWDEALRDGAPPRGMLGIGDRLRVDGIGLRVLWPPRGSVGTHPLDDGKAINDTSVVLLGAAGPRSFLLMGDLEEDIDPQLIAAGLPDVDVLKVAHHGSRTATTTAFLAATRPEIAAISAGRDNDYGHPAPELLERLAEQRIRTYRTDLDGTIDIGLAPGDIMVTTAKPRARGGSSRLATYHRLDGQLPSLGDRIGARFGAGIGAGHGAARLPLGRRRLWPGGRPRRLPERCRPVSGRPTRPLAPRRGSRRTRPPPR